MLKINNPGFCAFQLLSECLVIKSYFIFGIDFFFQTKGILLVFEYVNTSWMAAFSFCGVGFMVFISIPAPETVTR